MLENKSNLNKFRLSLQHYAFTNIDQEISMHENPKYLFSLIPIRRSLYSTRNIHNISLPNTKHNFFNFFFPPTIIEWISLDPHLWKSENFLVFKSNTHKFIRPSPNSVYNCHSPRGIPLITSKFCFDFA